MSAEKNMEAIVHIGKNDDVSAYLAPREACWGLVLQELGKKLVKRGFEVTIASRLKDAAEHVVAMLVPQSGAKSVAFGGSMSVADSGLLESLKNVPGLEVMETMFPGTRSMDELMESRRQALLSDMFLCSVNAITREGEMLMVDGFGNRTAAVQFGPRKVVLLVGRNKICASRESAEERLKTVAAPANGIRLKKDTPCAVLGYCTDCNNPGRMCSYRTLIQRCVPKGRIHVILIDEEVGY